LRLSKVSITNNGKDKCALSTTKAAGNSRAAFFVSAVSITTAGANTMKHIDPDFIPREQAAALCGRSVRTLIRREAAGEIPAPYRFGYNCVRYSKRELMAYLEAQASREQISA
jgi:predicted DNA-binding transcriptional regulator AlpA